jgi:3-oxoadipate enol-lactonase
MRQPGSLPAGRELFFIRLDNNMISTYFLDPHPAGRPAVLLLHGLGANSASWTFQLPSLIEAGFRPIAPDAPGFSRSPYDGKGWSVATVAQTMADLLAELQTGPAHIVGISMGGVIAQQMAFDFPQRIRKLVLVNTFSALRPESLGSWMYLLGRFAMVHTLGLPVQAKVVARRIFALAEQEELRKMLITTITQSDPRAYRAAMRALALFDSRRRLAEIRNHTLVITGDQDTTVPPLRQKLLVEGIPGARQVVIPNAGHAVSVEQADAFNRELLAFLKE